MVHNSDFTTRTVVVVVSVSFVNLAAGAWTHWTAPPPQYNLPSVASDCRTIAKSGRSAYIRGQYPHCAPTINYVMPTDCSIGNKWANWWPPHLNGTPRYSCSSHSDSQLMDMEWYQKDKFGKKNLIRFHMTKFLSKTSHSISLQLPLGDTKLAGDPNILLHYNHVLHPKFSEIANNCRKFQDIRNQINGDIQL